METILIKNGRIFDAAAGTFTAGSVAVAGGKIADPEKVSSPDITIDGTGCIVTPGLIDAHLHISSHGGVPVDLACIPNGVTTALDGGSCGESNYQIFHSQIAAPSLTRVYSALNMSSTGLGTSQAPENLNPAGFAPDRIKECFVTYPDELISLKIRLSKGIIPDNDTSALEAALNLADEIGCSLTAHITNPAIPLETVASMLRKGDIFCHCFQGTGETILSDRGEVKPAIIEARERGVLFDACHGMVNFDNNVAATAIRQGFYPDIISTDYSPKTFYRPPVVSLPRLVSKFTALGMSLEETLKRVTLNPARMLGAASELGDLSPESTADIAIFKIEETAQKFPDFQGNPLEGNIQLSPKCTIREGKILYTSADLDMTTV